MVDRTSNQITKIGHFCGAGCIFEHLWKVFRVNSVPPHPPPHRHLLYTNSAVQCFVCERNRQTDVLVWPVSWIIHRPEFFMKGKLLRAGRGGNCQSGREAVNETNEKKGCVLTGVPWTEGCCCLYWKLRRGRGERDVHELCNFFHELLSFCYKKLKTCVSPYVLPKANGKFLFLFQF